MKISNTSIYFLFLHSTIFILFLVINLILMKYYKRCWNGIPETECGTIIDSFYYTTATHTSIGFGDITPKSRTIKFITSLHMITVFVLIILNIDVANN